MTRQRGFLYVSSVIVLIAPLAVWIFSSATNAPATIAARVGPAAVAERATVPASAEQAARVELAARDPMALVHLGHERYEKEVREYRCVLVKQERLEDGLTPVQEIELRYRESPRTVYMLWKTNADQARRALYIDDAKYVDKEGHKLARVEPAGAVIRLFVKDVLVAIDSPDARKASRRTIDECGFAATFDLLENYNRVAAERGVLDLRYAGAGEVDGRPTYMLVRNLPYAGPRGPYPDARMVMHLDQEWLLPVAVYSYADREGTQLLGSYIFTQIELNPGFNEESFKF